MHVNTHLKPASDGKTGLALQADGMVEHDGQVGELLKFLEDNKIADNTLVVYSTDNDAMKNQWPDAGVSPFRSERDTNWEDAFRVPCVVRWPGVIKAGTFVDGLFSAEDWLPTLVTAGDATIKDKPLKGYQAGTKTFKVHLDGYNQLPLLKGETTESPRKEFVFFDDDGNLVAYRDERFKYSFAIQYAKGMNIWRDPMMTLRAPIMIDLKADPFEYAVDGSVQHEKWVGDRSYLILPVVDKVARYLASFREFPPRQRPASFSIDQVVDKLNASIKSARRSPCVLMTCLPLAQTNPAEALGGTGGLQRPIGGEYGICVFTDIYNCEEEAMFREEGQVDALCVSSFITSPALVRGSKIFDVAACRTGTCVP
jgi:Sulfatase